PGTIPASAKQPVNTADPAYAATAQALVDQADAVIDPMEKRAKAAQGARAAWNPNEQRVLVRRDRATALGQIVFGRSFMLLPTFAPLAADAQALAVARASAAAIVGADGSAVPRWLQQLTHVRAGASRFDLVATAVQLLSGAAPAPLEILQMPDGAAARWLALPPEPTDA